MELPRLHDGANSYLYDFAGDIVQFESFSVVTSNQLMASESKKFGKGLLKGPIKRRPNAPVAAVPAVDYAALFQRLTRRYGEVTPDALESILCPVLIPIGELDKTISRIEGQGHFRGSFEVTITKNNQALLVPGRTGKFVPRDCFRRRLAGTREGTNRIGGSRGWRCERRNLFRQLWQAGRTSEAIELLNAEDFWEVDQYGASAKVLSGLVEYSLVQVLSEQGYAVLRMPEDRAKHIGGYAYFDFEVSKGGFVKRVEAKSLWGTNTRFARLIHKKDVRQGYSTSSCKFSAQDFFAVSLFLRDGNIRSFAFARSVPKDVKPYGLPRAAKHPEHVNQNPPCSIGDGTWFASLDDVWALE